MAGYSGSGTDIQWAIEDTYRDGEPSESEHEPFNPLITPTDRVAEINETKGWKRKRLNRSERREVRQKVSYYFSHTRWLSRRIVDHPVPQFPDNEYFTIRYNESDYRLISTDTEWNEDRIMIRNVVFMSLSDFDRFNALDLRNNEFEYNYRDIHGRGIVRRVRNVRREQTEGHGVIIQCDVMIGRLSVLNGGIVRERFPYAPREDAVDAAVADALRNQERIATQRGSGRTTRAIQRCLAADGIYVVIDGSEAQLLRNQYSDLSVAVVNDAHLLGAHRPLFYDHYVTELHGYTNVNSEGFKQPQPVAEKEFKLTELLTLKLEPVEQAYERGTTRRMESNIYVAGVKFRSCKYLLLNIDTSNKDLMHQQEDIDSIDEAAELLSTEMETDHSIIEPETEFWGHCSNLQVWCENDYDPRILHSSISLPLAVELIKQGEFKAKESLLKEIERRLKKTGFKAYKMFKSYFVYYTKEEMDVLREELMQSEFFIKSMMESKFKGYLKGGND